MKTVQQPATVETIQGILQGINYEYTLLSRNGPEVGVMFPSGEKFPIMDISVITASKDLQNALGAPNNVLGNLLNGFGCCIYEIGCETGVIITGERPLTNKQAKALGDELIRPGITFYQITRSGTQLVTSFNQALFGKENRDCADADPLQARYFGNLAGTAAGRPVRMHGKESSVKEGDWGRSRFYSGD